MSFAVALDLLPLAAAMLLAAVALLAAHGRRWWLAAVFAAGLMAIATAAWQQRRVAARPEALAAAAGTAAPAHSNSVATTGQAAGQPAADAVRIKQLEEKLARLQQAERGRMIDDQTAAALAGYLRPFGRHQVVVSCLPDDVEAFDYANQFVTLLQDAGWDARGPQTTRIFGGEPSMRIAFYVNGARLPEAAKLLAEAFRKFDIPYESRMAPSDTMPAPDSVELFVPPKSAPAEAASGTAQPPRR